ncbi:MAG TPA: DHA2 family efflux MFS transporter permease subunit [Streptosporangiaceae bacterium]|nr:DHA2 family efflux MFS transporter permease subunit [Streptosporangiaceae bacterium]
MNAAGTRRWWALIALALAVLVVGLDLTVLNLALPTLAADLHASTSDLQWFVDAYTLVIAAVLLPAGLMGDRYGRKRVLLISLALFGVASIACAYSSSAGGLIAARAVLGLGAAAILPLSLSVLPVMFTPQERPRAIAGVTGAVFVSYPVGPILGGWLLDNFWWGSVFLINVPVVLVALIAVAVLLPESRSEHRPRVDVAGIAISSAGLTGLTYGVIKAGQDGWGDAIAIATMVAGVAALTAFVAWERRVSRRGDPLVDLTLFRSAGFTWGTILTTLVSFALFGLLFAMPLYFQDVRGLDALGSGVRLLPMIGGMMAGLVVGSRLQDQRDAPGGEPGGEPRVNAKVLVTIGFVLIAVGLAVGGFTGVHSSTGYAATWFAVIGLGLGVSMPAAMNAALGALSAERSGSGSAVITAMRQVGATIGVAVLGTVITSVYRGGLDLAALPGQEADAVRTSVASGVAVAQRAGSAALLDMVRTAFVHAVDVMLWLCAGIALAAAVLALAFLPRRADGGESGREQVRTADEIAI